MTSYETLYKGSEDIFMPKYAPSGYNSEISSLGLATDPRTATQLNELNIKMNPGSRHMEVGALGQEVMDSIPKQHFEEMRRLAKNTGVSLSFHAPIIEASGVGQRGGWEEVNRIGAERQIESTLKRAHDLDPKGNVNVTVHSSAQLPEMITRLKEDGKERTTGMLIINPETGKVHQIEYEKRYFPKEGETTGEFTGKERFFNPEEELAKINKETWTAQLSDINRNLSNGQDVLDRVRKQYPIPEDTYKEIAKGKDFDSLKEIDKDVFKDIQRNVIHGQIYLKDAYTNLQKVFDRAYQTADGENKRKLKKYAEEISPLIKKEVEQDPQILAQVVEKGVRVLNDLEETPKLWKKMNDFVVEQSAKTYGNAATNTWKEFHETAPVLTIENPPAGSGLSRAEDLKKLIEESRKVVVENLKKEGVSKSEAEKTAANLISATWDVGHINMIRKMGFSEKDVIREAEIIAPFVKHVHLSDNFGLEHTELPMGMGNVPLKEVMKKLGEKGFEGKKIIEAGNWWQHFAEKGGGNPFKPSIEGMNSPLYSTAPTNYWSTPPGFGAYYSGQGAINPAVHHKLYGAGFENLPMELGGEIPGERGRFSGAPNQ
ncbi:sugar phosphate isomerase/epimerase [Candidatus Pacearchaeota archaeon]|nr:sugar phosphate isomerase/epimerase [Candidatus Pacearchaeota archaeon]